MEKESNVIEGKFRAVDGGKTSKPLPGEMMAGNMIEIPPELGMLLLLALMSGQHGKVGIYPRD